MSEQSLSERAQSLLETTAKSAQDLHSSQPWSPELVKFLVLAVLVFTVIALLLSTVLLWKRSADPSAVLRIFGVLAIIGVSAILLVAGYSNQQLTPIIGLFGAIAGYLLGRDANSKAGPTQ